MEFSKAPEVTRYLSLTFFVSWFGLSTVWYFLPVYFEQHIESVFLIGVLTSLPPLIPVLIDIPVGNLVQRIGEKKVLFTGMFLNMLPAFAYMAALPAAFLAGKLIEGVAKSSIWSSAWTLTLRSADADHEAESTSVFLLGKNLATVIAPAIGGLIIMAYSFNAVFWIWAATTALSLVVFLIYIGLDGKPGVVSSFEELFERETYSNDFKHLKNQWKSLRLPFFLIFLYSIIFSFHWLAVPLLLEDIGSSYAVMGLVFSVAFIPTLFQYFFGELADRIGDMKATATLALATIPFLIGMGFATETLVVGTLYFLVRLFTGGISPALHAFYDSRVPDEIEGEMTGFMEVSKHSGQAIGPLAAGAVSSLWGVSASFYFAATVAGCILVVSGLAAYRSW